MEIYLPGVVSSPLSEQVSTVIGRCVVLQKSFRNLSLEVGEDRVVVKTRPNLFFLDVDLPFLVDNDNTGAQFDAAATKLTVTLSVTGRAPI